MFAHSPNRVQAGYPDVLTNGLYLHGAYTCFSTVVASEDRVRAGGRGCEHSTLNYSRYGPYLPGNKLIFAQRPNRVRAGAPTS